MAINHIIDWVAVAIPLVLIVLVNKQFNDYFMGDHQSASPWSIFLDSSSSHMDGASPVLVGMVSVETADKLVHWVEIC